LTVYYLIILATVQGITEFLPVSSSGHLALIPLITDRHDQGYLIDAAAHLGTLLAVIVYFRQDVASLVTGTVELLTGQRESAAARLALNIMVATLPILPAGLVLHLSGYASMLRNLTVIGLTTLIFGIVLYLADRRGQRTNSLQDMGMREALVLGLFQIASLVPGTSRSGITITAARMMGYHRRDTVKVSLLMSIPTLSMAGVLSFADMTLHLDMQSLVSGMFVAFISFMFGIVAISLMMRFLKHFSFTPYVIYRLALGVILLMIAWG